MKFFIRCKNNSSILDDRNQVYSNGIKFRDEISRNSRKNKRWLKEGSKLLTEMRFNQQ